MSNQARHRELPDGLAAAASSGSKATKASAAVSPFAASVPQLRRLAWFRYQLRQFLRFSEQAARRCGVTPQQHQLMLGVGGFTGRGWATISELAEFLQERHNAVVGLVDRAARKGLVSKQPGERDRRFVRVRLTAQGESLLARISELNRRELERVRASLLAATRSRPKLIVQNPGA
jgi:DNA-binding MarR family transcriptional regulator